MVRMKGASNKIMSERLKACPYCGGEGKVIPQDASAEYPDGGHYGCYYVKCESCGAHTGSVHTRPNAISEWELRHVYREFSRANLRQMYKEFQEAKKV